MTDIENALAQVVSLGDAPSEREIELGQAVQRHVSNRPRPINQSVAEEVVRALIDARNAIEAALAYMEVANRG